MKTCFKCGEEKEITEFYKHSEMADGRLGKCKECTKKDVKENYVISIERIKEYEQQRHKKPERKEKKKLYELKRRKASPEKYAAKILFGHATLRGKIFKQPCEVCGKEKVEGHHDDYYKPLEVRWLCRKHHLEIHNKKCWVE